MKTLIRLIIVVMLLAGPLSTISFADGTEIPPTCWPTDTNCPIERPTPR